MCSFSIESSTATSTSSMIEKDKKLIDRGLPYIPGKRFSDLTKPNVEFYYEPIETN